MLLDGNACNYTPDSRCCSALNLATPFILSNLRLLIDLIDIILYSLSTILLVAMNTDQYVFIACRKQKMRLDDPSDWWSGGFVVSLPQPPAIDPSVLVYSRITIDRLLKPELGCIITPQLGQNIASLIN